MMLLEFFLFDGWESQNPHDTMNGDIKECCSYLAVPSSMDIFKQFWEVCTLILIQQHKIKSMYNIFSLPSFSSLY